MKVVILVYSLTGTTHHIAKTIAKVLDSAGHVTQIVDIVPATRDLLCFPGSPSAALDEIRSAVSSAEAIGAAALTWYWHCPPGVTTVIRAVAPSFAGKPGFHFATAGQTLGFTSTELHDALEGGGARVIASWFSEAAPDTWYMLGPRAEAGTGRCPWKWGQSEIDACLPFSEGLARSLTVWATGDRSTVAQVPRPQARRLVPITLDLPENYRGKTWIRLRVLEEKCTGCSLCVQGCPGDALQLVRKAGDRMVVSVDPSRCFGCSRCVARCPAQAIVVPGLEGNRLWNFSPSAIKPGGNNFSPLRFNLNLVRNGASRYPGIVFTVMTALVLGTAFLLFRF